MSTVGIIGGGQLARMTHQAAIALGVDVVVLCPEPNEPAVAAGARHLAGRPERLADLIALAEQVDVVTVDHEQTPASHLAHLAELGHRVAPGAQAARLGQDKAEARVVLADHGIPTAPWITTEDPAAIDVFGVRHGWPLVLKAPTGGYDGRGVWMATSSAEARRVLAKVGGELLVEPTIAFRHELSVLVVRSTTGETVAYPPVETVQRDGQCAEVFVPAAVPEIRNAQARSLAVNIAEAVELVGAMAVELFETSEGLLLNELAVRPHNSGHLTIESCTTSQFENHLRAVLGLPLGATDLVVPAAAMANVVGTADGSDPFARMAHALAVPGARVHCYAKQARPNRKLGHITATGPTVAAARAITGRALGAMAAGRAA
jgi:5-(carboxyamino)imidazole ribonucleotide synthase